jgi:hypothetical protein
MVTRGRGSFQFTSLLGIPTTANGRQLLRRRNCAFSNAVNGAKASASLRSRVLAVAGKKIDPKREARMVDEIIVDTYTEDERSMSSYYHLEGALRFPFEAECVKPRTISPLRKGEKTRITAQAITDWHYWVTAENAAGSG